MKKHGKEAFLAYYRTLFDSDEAFELFLEALSKRTLPILRIKPSALNQVQKMWGDSNLSWNPLPWFPTAVEWPPEAEFGTTLPGYNEHLIYPMNRSSLLPPLALKPEPGERVLDAAAAPGGKTLILADEMNKQGELIANDLSPARSFRLRTLLQHWEHEWVHVTTSNAATLFRTEPESFDKILLDAPCSSEKHVWNSQKHLKEWSLGRVKRLVTRQFGLLSGLWRALKPGGRIVYSTCAVTPEENERIIERFLEKYKDEATLRSWDLDQTPGTGSHLRRIAPDDLHDPMFIAIIEKKI